MLPILLTKKNKLFFSCLIFCLVVFQCFLVYAENAPKMIIENDDIDIGFVNPGEDAVAEFLVINKGDADLVLDKVKPT